MFKSIRKGGRIAAVAIGLIAALTPLATPPAAFADGVPTPELEKSITVDGHNVLTFTDNGRYAVIEERDSDYNIIGYSRVDLTSGKTVQINIPKSSLSTVHVSCDDECLCWLDEDGLIVYSIEDQQETTHPISAKKAGVSSLALAENGKTLTIEYSNKENKTTKVDLFDLQLNEKTLTYKFKQGDVSAVTSKDGNRLYINSYRKKKSQLKIIDTTSGTTSVKEIPHNGKCYGMIRRKGSDSIILCMHRKLFVGTYFVADYDGNIDEVANGNSFIFNGIGSTRRLLPAYTNGNTLIIDSDSGKQIGLFKTNNDESVHAISKDGKIALATGWNENTAVVRLIDIKTGQRSEYKIKPNGGYSCMVTDDDQKILIAYSDEKHFDKLHIDIYKSNIHYSPIDNLIFFTQDNMPIVIGGGIAAVLIIIGGIAVVCIRRKKRSADQADTPDTAHKTKSHKHGRRKKHAQQEQIAQQPSADAAFDTQQQSTAEPFADIPQQPVASTAPKFCRHCGNPLVPESKFCPKCGHPVE